jgi:chloramphenicol 3-O phosphotransferase
MSSDPLGDLRLIVLNGTSSSGKTTLARALLERLPGQWLSISGDHFIAMSPGLKEYSGEELRSFWVGAYRAIAALCRSGNRAVVDLVVMKAFWLLDLAEALDGLEALFVGVRCPLEVAEERERARTNATDPLERRKEGIAKWQFEFVHAHGTYDVEVDTSVDSANECASAVIARAEAGSAEAFATLLSERRGD